MTHITKDEALKLALEALGQLWLLGDEAAVIANPAITAIKQARALDKKAENARELGLDYEPAWCGHCNGSGRMVRDPDIGTDQKCFVCDGAGVPAAPVQEPVAWMFEDDEDNGHKTFRQTPPSPEAIAYLAKWNRPAWVPLYTTPPAAPVQVEHCIWARNGNTPCPHTAAPVQEPSLSKMDVAEAIKTLCAIGELPDSFEDVADWVAAGEIPTPPAAPVQDDLLVGYFKQDDFRRWVECSPLSSGAQAFCATPPAAQRQWVGLTAGERDALFTKHYQWDDYGKAIEAKLKEKNL